jgi:hypothetical protein
MGETVRLLATDRKRFEIGGLLGFRGVAYSGERFFVIIDTGCNCDFNASPSNVELLMMTACIRVGLL